MRLKTKFQDEDFDLGEVVEANIYYGGNGRVKVIAEPTKGGMITFYFETLKGMNELFEDYEEPKEYWFIDAFGNIVQNRVTKHRGDEYIDMSDAYERQKQIGNHFKTEEEAEKAVEKLKAWKRLKDKGFRFKCCDDYHIDYELTGKCAWTDETEADLDLLFGGER